MQKLSIFLQKVHNNKKCSYELLNTSKRNESPDIQLHCDEISIIIDSYSGFKTYKDGTAFLSQDHHWSMKLRHPSMSVDSFNK
jgi:predicted RNA-binding protein